MGVGRPGDFAFQDGILIMPSSVSALRDKAISLIKKTTGNTKQAEEIVQALTDERLLFVDLPTPDEEGRFSVGERKYWIGWGNSPCTEVVGLHGYTASEGATIPLGEPGECLDVAQALIAAHHQENEEV